jgi:hypothetical protein
MVSATDDPRKSRLSGAHDTVSERPRKRRFGLFSALAAPFRDVDERALHKKNGATKVRNNSKGNLFVRDAATPAKVSVRRFPRGSD